MKSVTCWYWLIPTPTPRGTTLKTTRHRMHDATAIEAHPGAVKVPDTLELCSVPGIATDLQANSTGAWLRSKWRGYLGAYLRLIAVLALIWPALIQKPAFLYVAA